MTIESAANGATMATVVPLKVEPAGPTTGGKAAAETAALDSASDVTRLLCAGVYLDHGFRNAVLRILTKDPNRYAAPAYGYDAARVVAHAEAYRERRIVVRIFIGGLFFINILMTLVGGEAAFVTFLCAVWLSWVAVFFERLYVHNVLTRYLRKPAPTDSPSAAIPYPPYSNTGTSRLAPEQSVSAGLVYYSGYNPFVGAGEKIAHWAFPILLVPRQDTSLPRLLAASNGEATLPDLLAPEITIPGLLSYVERRLGEVLRTELQDAHRIDQLEITRRWYRTAVTESRPTPPDRVDLRTLADRQGQEEYGSPREYLCAHIGSWKQELVTSAFLGFDIKGRTLHIEFHACELKPIKPAFHRVDFYPRYVGTARILRIAVESALHMIGAVVSIPVAIAGALARSFGEQSGPDTEEQGVERDSGFKDYGARESIRELAAHAQYHHYFQEVDSDKYLSIVQRWIDQIILEYLEFEGVDLSEFRSKRPVTLVNTGVVQTGGELNVEGGVAVGTGATITVNTPQDAAYTEPEDLPGPDPVSR